MGCTQTLKLIARCWWFKGPSVHRLLAWIFHKYQYRLICINQAWHQCFGDRSWVFLCPNGTIFNQVHSLWEDDELMMNWWWMDGELMIRMMIKVRMEAKPKWNHQTTMQCNQFWLVQHDDLHYHLYVNDDSEECKNDRRNSGVTLRQKFNLIDFWHSTNRPKEQ